MSYLKSQELVRIKKLIDISKLDEADQLIKRFEEKREHTLHDMIFCHLLKCQLLSTRGLYEEIIKIAEKAYKESLGLGKNILSVDILLIMADALLSLDRDNLSISRDSLSIDKAQKIIKEGEELLKTLTLALTAEYTQRKAYIACLKGCLYTKKNDLDRAIKQYELSLSLREELGNKTEIARSLYLIADVYMFQKRDLERCSKYLERGMTIAEECGHKGVLGFTLYYMGLSHRRTGEVDRRIRVSERALAIFHDINNKFMEARVLGTLGECFGIKGEINRSIRFFEQSLELSKEINYKWAIADAFNSLSFCYYMKGDLDRALECVEQAMVFNRELGALYYLALNHDLLIQILIDMGDLERARNFLRDLEQLNSQLKHKRVKFIYFFNKALLLKTNPRARDRGLAEEILKNLLKDESYLYEDRLLALVNLCDLLLMDFQITNLVEILEEIKPLIEQLLVLSEKSHSTWILGETYLLQAKLALINFDVKTARRLLTQAQKIAESYGIKRLAMKISHEHDELLKQIKIWEDLKESEVSLSERWKLAGLNEQIEKMVRKQIIDIPEISEEAPVFLLIVSEGGIPLFSHSFIKEKSIESQIFGGFVTTIDYFIRKMFSEGLDRAIFGEYTLLMKSIPPFFISYIFKGDSYYALQRIIYFVNHIQKEGDIWQNLLKSYQINQFINLKDIPLLESLITEIFIAKSIAFNE